MTETTDKLVDVAALTARIYTQAAYIERLENAIAALQEEVERLKEPVRLGGDR